MTNRRSFDANQRELLFVLAGGQCMKCKEPLGPSFHADHVIPWSKGGATTIENGQALCPGCNLEKSNMVINPKKYAAIADREWQVAAMEAVSDDIAAGVKQHLCVACPGAGKTRWAIAVARALKDAGLIDFIIIVSPKDVIRSNWTSEAKILAKLNILSITSGSMRQQNINSLMTYDGFSTTYQSNANGYGAIRNICENKKVLVLLDEIHWARCNTGKNKQKFGQALHDAFDNAAHILSLSGTPWRSDRCPIPFVPYKESGEVDATYNYTYSSALEQKACRPVIFHRMDGVIIFDDPALGYMRGELGAETEAIRSGDGEYNCIQLGVGRKYLRAATDPDINMARKLIGQAHKKLMAIRKYQPTAGGLIIARRIEEAKQIAEQMSDDLNVEPIIVNSHNSGSRQEIEAFASSAAPWIISCDMITEGTDIPRLRVGVHLHTTMTTMHFRQFCGRFVRWENDAKDGDKQCSHIFIPQYGPLHLMAQDIEEEVPQQVRDDEAKNERDPCAECGQKPCVCLCMVCGESPCVCDTGIFVAIESECEDMAGSTSRGDDYTKDEQEFVDAAMNDDGIRRKYSEVQLQAFSKMKNDKTLVREGICASMSDADFESWWEAMHGKEEHTA